MADLRLIKITALLWTSNNFFLRKIKKPSFRILNSKYNHNSLKILFPKRVTPALIFNKKPFTLEDAETILYIINRIKYKQFTESKVKKVVALITAMLDPYSPDT